jgi:hypothetical protein
MNNAIAHHQPTAKDVPTQSDWLQECSQRLDQTICYDFVTIKPDEWQGNLTLILSRSTSVLLECAAATPNDTYDITIDKLKRLSLAYYDTTNPQAVDFEYPSYTLWQH